MQADQKWNLSFNIDRPVAKLGLLFGDQLTTESALFAQLDGEQSAILMLEVLSASQQPRSSWQRSTLFLSAMRHFASQCQANWPDHALHYVNISQRCPDFVTGLQAFIDAHRVAFPEAVVPELFCVLPGDNLLKGALDEFANDNSVTLNWLGDSHFISKPGQFKQWLTGRKKPRMEYYYRVLRQQTGYLMESVNGKLQPVGGQWNYDKDNRKNFGKQGPQNVPRARTFPLDGVVAEVVQSLQTLQAEGAIDLVGIPLSLTTLETEGWIWPVTREQALQVLADFVAERLPYFGDFQDAMWQDEPWLFHARISAALNLKLLNPREVIEAVILAYEQGRAPLNAVEGFVRQVLGWREYIRGLYWSYRDLWPKTNHLQAQRALPGFFWTGKTHMNCQAQAISQVLQTGYGHHIQRLMVTGLFSLLYGVKPQQIHEWYLGLFVDAVDWVEIPNTIGMSQFAEGGIVGSKPYIASGAYIQKMSNYCKHCRYQPTLPAGENACPISTLYWDFIARHQNLLEGHPRLGMQWRNWQNKTDQQQTAIRTQAQWLFENIETI